jgi:uncharacterized YigZ family protein
METKFFFNTIVNSASTEYKEKGSKFIAYANPIVLVEDFKTILNDLKKEHPKATHHCFAYRLGLDGNNFRVSDDGEPSGTAGKPILGQIDSRHLTNTLVVVVRYFGGTLLGVPGLINAYKSASTLVLQLTPVTSKPVEARLTLQFDYTQVNEVMTILKQCGCTVIKQELLLFCMMNITVPLNRREETIYRLRNVRSVELNDE